MENVDPREEFEKSRSLIKAMEALLACEGWQTLCKILQEQIGVRNTLVPMNDVSAVLDAQCRAGEIAGISLVIATPEALLESAKSDLEHYKRELARKEDD